jgi:hypothetical protein
MDERRDWKRSGDEWQREMDRAIALLLRKQEKIDRILSGDPIAHEDGMETRLHLAERGLSKLDATIGNHERGLWKEIIDLRGDITNLRFDLKDIKQDKSIVVETRRDTLTYRASIIAGWLGLFGFVLSNLDKVAHGVNAFVSIFKPPDKALRLEQLRRQIVELRMTRGPAVEAKLKKLEDEAKRLNDD